MRRKAVLLRTSRTEKSNMATSTTLLALATPTRLTKSRTAWGGTPRRRSPARVGMRGSSQPLTCPPRTSSVSTRLDSTVWVRLRRGKSYCRRRGGSGRRLGDQADQGGGGSTSCCEGGGG